MEKDQKKRRIPIVDHLKLGLATGLVFSVLNGLIFITIKTGSSLPSYFEGFHNYSLSVMLFPVKFLVIPGVILFIIFKLLGIKIRLLLLISYAGTFYFINFVSWMGLHTML